ncbi:MAG TPA: hypothetical protein PK950_03255, partial [Candidatus Paceibacterota bacterium]|nr:hypothetical protein [Candidatus Paceibacterota bacterium]
MHFPWRKKTTPEGQSVDGIIPNSKKLILSLREKVWTLEISPVRMREFWLRHKKTILALMVILSVLITGLFSESGKAGVANFYATQCLGGWENPSNASGEPTLKEDAEGSTFNSNNAAVLNNTQGDLYCGGFTGSLPENTDPEKISLKIRWTMDDGEVSHDVDPLADFVDPAQEEAIQTSEEQIDTPVELLPVDEEPQVLLPIIIIPESEAPAEAPAPQDTPQPAPAPESAPAPQGESSEGAFNFRLFKTARAQEAVIEQTDSVEQVDTVEQTVVDQVDNVEQVDSIESAEVSVESPEVAHFMAIEYSVDGSTWIPFTKISRADWRSGEYVFPENAFFWSDVDKLQVRLTSLASIDSPKVIYVDAMWLDVAYQTVEPDPLPQPDFSKDTVISYTENNGVFAVLLERDGERMLWYTKTEEGKYSLKELMVKKQKREVLLTSDEIKAESEIKPDIEKSTDENTSDEKAEIEKTDEVKSEVKAETPQPKVITNQDALQEYEKAFSVIWTLVDTSGSLDETTSLSVFESTLLWVSPEQRVFYGYNTNTNGIFSQSIDEGANTAELLFMSDAG